MKFPASSVHVCRSPSNGLPRQSCPSRRAASSVKSLRPSRARAARAQRWTSNRTPRRRAMRQRAPLGVLQTFRFVDQLDGYRVTGIEGTEARLAAAASMAREIARPCEWSPASWMRTTRVWCKGFEPGGYRSFGASPRHLRADRGLTS